MAHSVIEFDLCGFVVTAHAANTASPASAHITPRSLEDVILNIITVWVAVEKRKPVLNNTGEVVILDLGGLSVDPEISSHWLQQPSQSAGSQRNL
jgi:hypothetical protein